MMNAPGVLVESSRSCAGYGRKQLGGYALFGHPTYECTPCMVEFGFGPDPKADATMVEYSSDGGGGTILAIRGQDDAPLGIPRCAMLSIMQDLCGGRRDTRSSELCTCRKVVLLYL